MEGGPNIQEADNITDSSTEDEATGCGFCYSLCHPKGRLHRFVALFFMCFLGFGSYFCYDNPAALEDHLKKELNLTTTQYSLLYSLYSWPNTIFCFIGGFLLDRVFGIRLGTNIYMTLTLLGQVLFALGAFLNMFWLMLAGRLVFGIGAESLAVAQNNYTVLWFKGKELNMVFGLQLCLARIGSTVNFAVMESIYNWVNKTYHGPEGLGIILFIATTTCVFSMLCSIIVGLMDKRAERILRRNENSNPQVVQLKDLKNFKLNFWLITVICVFYYVAIFPFISFGKMFYKNRFHMDSHDANFITSLVYLSGAISPILGLLVDLTGRNLTWMTFAIMSTMGAHVMLGFTPINPYYGTVLMGVAYACLASGLWPLVSLIVPEYQLGTAYGICQAIQNFGLAVFSIAAGTIVDHFGYTWLEVFFIITLGVSLISNILLWILDVHSGGLLNLTPTQRKIHPDTQIGEERETLLDSENDIINQEDGLQPSTDFQIRNRYLSRIGAPLPDHYSLQNKGLSYRALR